MTRLTLERAIAETGDTIESPTALANAWAALPVFDDTAEEFQRLRADGWSLAVLTNWFHTRAIVR